MKKGKVYLIGAGPGDPELLTLKGKRCLEEADVIVGDYLADPRLLRYAKPGYEYIYVGKKAGCHTMKQHEISELLAEKGEAGRSLPVSKAVTPSSSDAAGKRSRYSAHMACLSKKYPASRAPSRRRPMRAFRSHIAVWQHPSPSLPDMKTRRKTSLPFTGTSWQAVSIH